MFQSLTQIVRLTSSLQNLQKQKQHLRQLITKSRTKTSTKKVQKQVANTIDDRISNAKQKLQLCEQLEKQIQNQQFVNAQFLVQDLVYDIEQLPQWFSFVFQKQFDKQRGTFSSMARKLYKQQGLYQKKNELANEIKTFQNLHRRFQSLNQIQRGCINLNHEAQTFENRVKLITQRFINFIKLIGSKVLQFVQENAQKSLSYSNQINSYARNPNNFQKPLQNTFNPPSAFNQQNPRSHSQAYKSNNRFHSTNPTFTDVNNININRTSTQMTRGQSPKQCLNHKHYYHNSNIYTSGDFYGERPHMVGYNQSKYNQGSRFNYRDHMPNWMSRTMASFYS